MSASDIPANIAEKPRRGRPPDRLRTIVRACFPEARSARSIHNKVALVRVAMALKEVDRELFVWLANGRRLTVCYELGRLPPELIPEVAKNIRLHNLGCARAQQYCRDMHAILAAKSWVQKENAAPAEIAEPAETATATESKTDTRVRFDSMRQALGYDKPAAKQGAAR